MAISFMYTTLSGRKRSVFLGFKLLQIKQKFGSNEQLHAYCQPRKLSPRV